MKPAPPIGVPAGVSATLLLTQLSAYVPRKAAANDPSSWAPDTQAVPGFNLAQILTVNSHLGNEMNQ